MTWRTIEAGDLKSALRTARDVSHGARGDGLWWFTAGGIEVVWRGTSCEVPGEGEGEAGVRISADAMRAVEGSLPRTGSVRVEVAGDRLRFGSFGVRCVPTRARGLLLAVDSTPRDVLALSYRCPRETIVDAGLEEEVDDVLERRDRAIAAAAERMAWMGVDAALVRRWVDDLFGPGPTGPRDGPGDRGGDVRIVEVDPRGQLGLGLHEVDQGLSGRRRSGP